MNIIRWVLEEPIEAPKKAKAVTKNADIQAVVPEEDFNPFQLEPPSAKPAAVVSFGDFSSFSSNRSQMHQTSPAPAAVDFGDFGSTHASFEADFSQFDSHSNSVVGFEADFTQFEKAKSPLANTKAACASAELDFFAPSTKAVSAEKDPLEGHIVSFDTFPLSPRNATTSMSIS
jgi:hypothetical protein